MTARNHLAMKLGLTISINNLKELEIKEYDKGDVTAGNIPPGYALIDTEINITDEYEIEEEGEDGEPETIYYVDSYRLYLLKIKTSSHGKIRYLLGYRPDECDFITFFKDSLEWDGAVPECLKVSRLFKNLGTLYGSDLHETGAWPKYGRDLKKEELAYEEKCYKNVNSDEETMVDHFRRRVLTDRLCDDIAEFLRPDSLR